MEITFTSILISEFPLKIIFRMFSHQVFRISEFLLDHLGNNLELSPKLA